MQNRHFIAAGLGSALALFAFAGLKVSAAPAFSAAAMSASSASAPASQISNYGLKSDRSALLRAPTGHQNVAGVPGAIVVIPELPDGCEPVISSIGNSPLAQVARSCLS